MNDKWYAQVAGASFDFLPDVLLGRWPVANEAQLAAVVDKTLLYEQPAPGDDGRWRKRIVMMSDDEWVRRNVSGFPGIAAHIRGCSEPDFERSIVRASDTVDGAFPGDLHAVRFLLREQSDRLCGRGVQEHCPVPLGRGCISDSTRAPHVPFDAENNFYLSNSPGTAFRALMDSVGSGALFFALQSHANRAVVTDEQIMGTFDRPYTPYFDNPGKPFVFFGFGCHTNEYGDPTEGGSSFTSGDCLGEAYLLEPQRGAIASYGSSGFEYLNPNNVFHELMWNEIFEKRYARVLGGGIVNADTLAARWRLAELLEIAEINYGSPDVIARYLLLGDPLLQLDAGVPRVRVDRIANGFLQANNRLVVQDRTRPIELGLVLADEQGIDSLWVVRRYAGGASVPIDSVTIRALVDTLPQVRAKRSYRVDFSVQIDACNFDVVVGARDLAGRVSEFVGRLLFDSRLLANGLPVATGDRIDPRTGFRFEIFGCTPIAPPLPLEVFVDGALRTDVVVTPDSARVNWKAEFLGELSPGSHALRFVLDGAELASYTLQTGEFGLGTVVAFPNPMRRADPVVRIFFHLGAPVSAGTLRILDLNGRTVLRRDLRDPGVVQSDLEVPPGQIGSGVGQDNAHWNYIAWDARDAAGDRVANGVYLYELVVTDGASRAQRHRDKLVLMR